MLLLVKFVVVDWFFEKIDFVPDFDHFASVEILGETKFLEHLEDDLLLVVGEGVGDIPDMEHEIG
jgi:hypothetical protein